MFLNALLPCVVMNEKMPDGQQLLRTSWKEQLGVNKTNALLLSSERYVCD